MSSSVDQPVFSISARAAARLTEVARAAAKETGAQPALRVEVLAGGCSGFQYRFALDENPKPDDVIIERDGARVIIDQASLELLHGAELDFTEALMGSHFAIRNPNAASSCGCGLSFAID
ncbi:MAG: iron-sulfur cluster assembly accessory protein [Acidobacteriia bacterium]|nr:iron-sulfur cluster assembly accessory protein [Methyloceanibacter sp.]MBX5471346.1 iron-sulfur cluster assembly accessory protein [Acetobacteraceae bacterium]MCL6491660.1 iron-sulfur cluster assembly accessory protein [Terriglobia bacterium]